MPRKPCMHKLLELDADGRWLTTTRMLKWCLAVEEFNLPTPFPLLFFPSTYSTMSCRMNYCFWPLLKISNQETVLVIHCENCWDLNKRFFLQLVWKARCVNWWVNTCLRCYNARCLHMQLSDIQSNLFKITCVVIRIVCTSCHHLKITPYLSTSKSQNGYHVVILLRTVICWVGRFMWTLHNDNLRDFISIQWRAQALLCIALVQL